MFKKTGGGGVHFEQSSLVNDTKKYLKYKKVAKNMGKGGGALRTKFTIHSYKDIILSIKLISRSNVFSRREFSSTCYPIYTQSEVHF